MLIELPVFWLIFTDIVAWLVIHLGVAWLATQFPDHLFKPDGWLYRERHWERSGKFYEQVFCIRAWKGLLPDGAALFKKGFRKAGLQSRSIAYLERFARETCRGELVHWIVTAAALLFFLWNPWPIGLVMIGYGVAANMPCILAQRYNRIRIVRLIAAGIRRGSQRTGLK